MASCQGRLIYPGQRYAQVMWERIPPDIEAVKYRTDQGEQVSFYKKPRSGGEPKRLWLVCNGNGGYALAWPDLLPMAHDREAGYLLLEYPGYGFSEGSCTPARILASSEAAVDALRSRLALPPGEFDARLSVFGHSLGAAAALQYAARHRVQRIVLAAPFTTMVDMGHHLLFWPCGQLIWHRFDNVARLAEVARQEPRPSVLILHGGDDTMIPPAMSAELAAPYSGWVERRVVPGVDHDDIVLDAVRGLAAP
ncbi:MAG: alpha/beta fold hydrolase [Planctomycetes bacterium]|nr:alpha/beta fold hydrolase [Planctomycetota bacterium]